MVDSRPRDPRKPSGSNNTLYFIVGALVVAVLIIGWFMYGSDDEMPDAVETTIETPAEPAAPAPEPMPAPAPEPMPAPEPAPAPAPDPAPAPAPTTPAPAN